MHFQKCSSSKEFKDKYIIIAIDSTGISYEQQRSSMDEREMECKDERRIFKNTCRGKCEDQARKFFFP